MKTGLLSLLGGVLAFLLLPGLKAASLDALPDKDRLAATSGTYLYLFISTPDGKQHFSFSGVTVTVNGETPVRYSGAQLPALVEKTLRGKTYLSYRVASTPDSGVRGLSGAAGSLLSLRLPINRDLSDIQTLRIQITCYIDETTGAEFKISLAPDLPAAQAITVREVEKTEKSKNLEFELTVDDLQNLKDGKPVEKRAAP